MIKINSLPKKLLVSNSFFYSEDTLRSVLRKLEQINKKSNFVRDYIIYIKNELEWLTLLQGAEEVC